MREEIREATRKAFKPFLRRYNRWRMYRREKGPPITLQPCDGSDVLLISFGGYLNRMGIPGLEFASVTQSLNVSRLFLCDQFRCFYHRGLKGYPTNIDETVAVLRQYVEDYGRRRVVCLGNSMGGYAALLFGALLDADEIHAFVPRTVVKFDMDHLVTNDGLRRAVKRLRRYRGVQDQYFDLKEVFDSRGYSGETNIYYGLANTLDTFHAERMTDLPNVCLHRIDVTRHTVARALRDSGELRRILDRSVEA